MGYKDVKVAATKKVLNKTTSSMGYKDVKVAATKKVLNKTTSYSLQPPSILLLS
jgi:hypothetical protein